MMVYKNPQQTIEQKILGYESVVKFYEKNREARFQDKSGLTKIFDEICLELEKNHKMKNLNELHIVKNRIINKFNVKNRIINKFKSSPFSFGKRD